MFTMTQPDIDKQDIVLQNYKPYISPKFHFALVAMVTKFYLLFVSMDQDLDFHEINLNMFGIHIHWDMICTDKLLIK